MIKTIVVFIAGLYGTLLWSMTKGFNWEFFLFLILFASATTLSYVAGLNNE